LIQNPPYFEKKNRWPGAPRGGVGFGIVGPRGETDAGEFYAGVQAEKKKPSRFHIRDGSLLKISGAEKSPDSRPPERHDGGFLRGLTQRVFGEQGGAFFGERDGGGGPCWSGNQGAVVLVSFRRFKHWVWRSMVLCWGAGRAPGAQPAWALVNQEKKRGGVIDRYGANQA